MKTSYRIPHVEAVVVPRPYILHLTFDDGLEIELEFVRGDYEGTVFERLADVKFFEQVQLDAKRGTVVWPNGVDLDPAVLHGDFPAAGGAHFREVARKVGKKQPG
jgi:uncharacterized protein DUF2442